eukprot:snap_masked-scaffold_15-processed-gene-6.1-mRNA-1 protein AED:1.00 eAED:1.00 QI:0/-1/0/0/-1/1/1/0/137
MFEQVNQFNKRGYGEEVDSFHRTKRFRNNYYPNQYSIQLENLQTPKRAYETAFPLEKEIDVRQQKEQVQEYKKRKGEEFEKRKIDEDMDVEIIDTYSLQKNINPCSNSVYRTLQDPTIPPPEKNALVVWKPNRFSYI